MNRCLSTSLAHREKSRAGARITDGLVAARPNSFVALLIQYESADRNFRHQRRVFSWCPQLNLFANERRCTKSKIPPTAETVLKLGSLWHEVSTVTRFYDWGSLNHAIELVASPSVD